MKFRGLVLGIAAALIVIGVVTLRNAPVDVYPEFTPPYVEIQTESLGLSAAEVEQLITVPLEADLLNGIEGVDVLRSSSLAGLSSIVLVFDPGFDVYKGRQLVQERLTQLGGAALPNISKPSTMLQPLSSQSRVMMIALDSDKLTPIERSVITRWTMRPRLMGVPGVANISVWGMRDRQIQVQVDPKRLADENVTLRQVVSTAGNAQIASPVTYLEASVPGTGGFIETPQQRLQVRNVFDKIASPVELGRVPVEGTGGRLRLTDVANVVQDHQPLIGDAVVNDGDGLLLVVEKFPGADVAEVTKGVEEALENLKPGLSGMQIDTSVFRPLSYLEDVLDNLALAIAIGMGLLALVLIAFLRQWRTALIAFVTIPVSMFAAALTLDLMGETFNAITFAGLALALVLVIDDAVVGAENVARRLRGRHAPGATASIVLKATHEVRSPLAYATAAALLVVVPIAIMEGRPGAFFEPLALAYAAAVVCAMIVALTLTPALSLLLPSRGAGSPLVARLTDVYDGALARLMGRPGFVIAGAGGCVAAVIVAIAVMNPSIVPDLKDRGVLVHLSGPAGASNQHMTRVATELGRDLRRLDGVENVAAHVGRAITGDRIVDVNSAEVVVRLSSGADFDQTFAAVDDAARRVQGARAEVVTASAQRIREVGGLDEGKNPVTGDGLDVLTGSDKPLLVRVYGENFATLRREADKLRRIMAQVNGVAEPRIVAPAQQPALEIEVDIEKAQRHGIKPGDVRRAEAIMLQGILVGSTFEDQKVFDVMVQGTPELRRSVAAVRDILIDKPGGGHVRLGDVAAVRMARTPIAIEREGVSRKLDIVADVSGRSVSAVASDLEKRLANVPLPLEYHARVLTDTVGDEIDAGKVIGFAVAAAALILLLLQAAVRSWRLAISAFLALPIAAAGGVIGALFAGSELSLGVAGGLLALVVLAIRSGLTLVRRLQDLEREGDAFGPDLVRRGACQRLAPTLTSAAAIGVLLLPFAVMGSRAGLEVIHPMAVVLLCGLVSWAALTLFVLPTLYMRLATAEDRGAVRPEEADELPLFAGEGADDNTAVVR